MFLTLAGEESLVSVNYVVNVTALHGRAKLQVKQSRIYNTQARVLKGNTLVDLHVCALLLETEYTSYNC